MALCLFMSVNYVQAQTVDEIIDTYFENIGGKENVAAIKSLKATAAAKVQGMDLPVMMYNKAPNKQRVDINLQGKDITQMSFDGNIGWGTNFMTMEAEQWDQQQTDIMKSQSEFPDPFLNYKEKGHTLTLEGEEEIEGVECFVLKLTREPVMIDGKEEENATTFFFDKENFVPIMQRSYAITGEQKGVASDTYMSDYDEVEGVFMAFTISTRQNGVDVFNITIDNIELNVEVADEIFAMPAKAPAPEEKK